MKPESPTVSIITLGCPKNQVDSEFLAGRIQAQGYMVKHEDVFADIILLNTCGFILDAKKQSIDTILYYTALKKEGKIKKLIVFGCLTERYKAELEQEIQEVDAFFGVSEPEKIVSWLLQKEVQTAAPHRLLSTPSHYAYLKIAEGCNRSCSFCSIPQIRGRYISRTIESLLEEAKQLVASGVKELIIIAQDTTYYGVDIYKEKKLPQLLKVLAEHSGAEWLRLHYTYPAQFPFEIIDIINNYPNICKYIDIPFQHVHDGILQSMKRNHSRKEIEDIIRNIRKVNSEIHIRTTFISGFPGETEQQHSELLDFIRQYEIDTVGVFEYSEEEGTYAAELRDDVPQKTKTRRKNELLKLQEQISLKKNLAKIGSSINVIIDEKHEDFLIGRTEYQSPEIDSVVFIQRDELTDFQPGQFIRVKVTGAEHHILFAEGKSQIL